MLKIAICDDDAATRAYLTSLIHKQSWPCEIFEFDSADDCFANIKEIELYFLDIDLNSPDSRINGMALARNR